jgi:hypothetical protein
MERSERDSEPCVASEKCLEVIDVDAGLANGILRTIGEVLPENHITGISPFIQDNLNALHTVAGFGRQIDHQTHATPDGAEQSTGLGSQATTTHLIE